MNFRQIQAILHSWFGILFLWLIFFIFLTGSIAYFRTEINVWSQPEIVTQVQKMPTTQHAAEMAFDYLNQHAADAKRWRVTVANERMPVNLLQWQDQQGRHQQLQNPQTGELLNPLRNTLGGDFFFKLHYTLYPIPSSVGSLIVAIAALILLISLITGIITHKKIIKEFFVFRSFKGQRTLLDLHHITGVITFPFYLVMAFTGLIILFYLVFPWGLTEHYGKDGIPKFYSEMQFVEMAKPQPSSESMQPFQSFITQMPERTDEGAILDKFEVQKPNTSEAMISFDYNYKNIITLNTPQYIFNANTAQQLEQPRNMSAIAQFASSTYGIHLGYFASMWMRFILALLGIIGCVMLAAGALLWQRKRIKEQNTFTYKLVQHINFFTFLGLPFASGIYLLLNRILPLTSNVLINHQVTLFYCAWVFSLIFSLILPIRRGVIALTSLTASIFLLIPLLSFMTIPEASLWNSVLQQRWSIAGVDIACLTIGFVLFAFLRLYIKKTRDKA
ncbi:PepSY domain-containing protein [Acinetobacter halotolerans]|uniref:PepSY domain-containing protein n=1 Tax=Acinetobacter halotolerans TaxID=1752076 RepID=A0A4Q6XCB2_9GAMM|nr:PepSY-associated TM helix domain-containing protein [Acinetobacter halotolerans]RZF54674.1 PepSY domain-containing protein [Acinetobacter halotolerans]